MTGNALRVSEKGDSALARVASYDTTLQPQNAQAGPIAQVAAPARRGNTQAGHHRSLKFGDLELASNLSVSRVLISGGAPRAQRKSPPKNLCLRAEHVLFDESAEIHVLRAIRAAMRD